MKASSSALTLIPNSYTRYLRRTLPEHAGSRPGTRPGGEPCIGEPLAAEADQLALAAAVLAHDDGLDQLLALDAARSADDHDVAHARVDGEHVLDLDRVDLVAAHVDQHLAPAGDDEPARLVEPSAVPGGERLAVLRVIPGCGP